jgi:hypothetical protein
MDEMKWSSSGFLLLCWLEKATYTCFGLALADICQTFGQQQYQEGMACPKSAITHSLHIMVTSNITHWTHMDEMKWSSSDFLALLAAASSNLDFCLALAEDSAKRAWHVQDQPHTAFTSW